jgi:hypothetical protein
LAVSPVAVRDGAEAFVFFGFALGFRASLFDRN